MKYLFLLFIVVLVSCSPESGEKLPPPQEIIMVEKISDMDTIESGIDAVPDINGIFIQWYLIMEANIESYNIYRKGWEENTFSRIATIPVEGVISSFDTIYSYIDADTSLVLNIPEYIYYYYVTATNIDGVEGYKPDSLTQSRYLLWHKPITNETQQNITINEQPILSWYYQNTIPPNYYIIRIENLWTEKLIWTGQFQDQELDGDVEVDLSAVPNPPEYQSGTMYRWRIDAVGTDPLFGGSESKWKTFTVQ